MRIHGNTLTINDIHAAVRAAGVTPVRDSQHGSRSRARAFDVILSGSGAYRSQFSMSDVPSATWDEWGMFLAALFRADESLTIPRVYVDAEHFRWATGGRFDTLTPAGQHNRHRWNPHGLSVTGTYCVAECPCGAINRWVASWHGYSWADISDAVNV